MSRYVLDTLCAEFQFTHPGRGATHNKIQHNTTYVFQFTHPGRGATQLALLEPLLR